MIYRDDDVSKYTDLTTIEKIHSLFIKYNKIHTVTLIMKDLWESRGVWEWLITTPNLDIALHGWKHEDYSKMCYAVAKDYLTHSLNYWKENLVRIGVEIPIKVWYPPWNATSDDVSKAALDVGLETNVDVDPSRVYLFHWWRHIGGRYLDELEKELSK